MIFLPRLEIVIVVFAEKRKTLVRGLFESFKGILITLRFHRILNYYPIVATTTLILHKPTFLYVRNVNKIG